jgi:hypothetical protein
MSMSMSMSIVCKTNEVRFPQLSEDNLWSIFEEKNAGKLPKQN